MYILPSPQYSMYFFIYSYLNIYKQVRFFLAEESDNEGGEGKTDESKKRRKEKKNGKIKKRRRGEDEG